MSALLHRARRSGAAAFLSLLAGCSVTAQSPDVLHHPAGFSLPLPAGWHTKPLDGTRYQLVPPDSTGTVAFVVASAPAEGVSSASDAGLLQRTNAEIRQAYPLLHASGAPRTLTTRTGPAVRLDFEGTENGQAVRMTFWIAVRAEQLVTMMAAGTAPDVARRFPVLDVAFAGVKAETVAAAPATTGGISDGSAVAREWVARLRGHMLTVMSGYSSSGSSGGMTSRSDLILQNDGHFTYKSSSSVSISVDGMSGSSSGRDAASGTWRISSRGGSAILTLTKTDRTQEQFELTAKGTQTFLNGTRAFVTTP